MRGRNTSGELRGEDWFAKQLGDGWQTSGDGIYEYVGEQGELSEPSDGERSPKQDFVDEIAPARQANDEANAPQRSRRRLRR